MRGEATKFIACACCGHRTITGDHEICSECHWQSDPVDEKYPDEALGPNKVSLNEARRNYVATGHSWNEDRERT